MLREEAGGTRLISRNRYRLPVLARAVLEPTSWVMERKMLRGIKQRAEHRRTLARRR